MNRLKSDEGPYLVYLQAFARQAAHGFFHEAFAAIADTDHEPHDRISVDAGHTLNGTDGIALHKG